MSSTILFAIVLTSVLCQVFTLEVYVDNNLIDPRNLLTVDQLKAFQRQHANDLDYIQGSRTYDTIRYGHGLPFSFTFSDRHNHHWRIVINRKDDVLTLMIPCGTQIIWNGGNSRQTRTGSDAQTSWAEVQFHYTGSSWFHDHGVRIAFVAYKERRSGEWQVDSERWGQVLDYVEQGTKITQSIMAQIEQVVSLIGKK